MQVIHGRRQKDRKRDPEDAPTGLGCSARDGSQNGDESNEAINPNSSWRDSSGEKGATGGQVSDGGMLRQLGAIKKSLLAHTDSNREILEDGLRRNEEYKRDVLNSINSLESRIAGLLGDSENTEE
jgi:hypothetical protein